MNRAYILYFLVPILLIISYAPVTHAQSVADIQAQIDANNKKLAELQAEIASFQKELDVIGTQKNTLQSTINTLTLNQKQLAAQIQVTQNKISSANLKIQSLTQSIGDKETSIKTNQETIGKALRSVAEDEESSLVLKLVFTDSLREVWQATEETIQFNQSLLARINDLREVRTALTTNRDQVSAEKANLVSLKKDLASQKHSVDASKSVQQQLLTQTKNKESNYQSLIAQKQAAGKAFEQELINLQGQLNLIVHPGLLPKVGSGVLSWPFSSKFMLGCARLKSRLGNQFCITQYFGNTKFATENPQIYHGKGHNAIDIAAPIGTPVQASLGGTVLGTGNTDLIKGCYSFGKWILVVHSNGLSTVYSHLSSIDVSKGQTVSTGQVIGLSGMTGMATGPHIHFGVYATEGMQIMTLRQFRGSKIGCADATMPVAALDAYLNPLSYL